MRIFSKKLLNWNKGGKVEPNINGDMKNVVNSMFLCDPIYDKLKVKCHPDKFTNETQRVKAESLFQELQKNRYNYEEMLRIEKEIAILLKNNL